MQRSFARNATSTVGSSIVGSALLAILLLLLARYVPKEEYGYYQLYLFFSSYLGYLSFGLADGLFVRFSGRPLGAIPARSVWTHFFVLVAVAGGLLTLLCLFAPHFFGLAQPVEALRLACLSSFFFLLRSLLTFVFQAANDSTLFAKATVLERLIHFVGGVSVLAADIKAFDAFVWTDVLARVIGFSYTLLVALRNFPYSPPNRASLGDVKVSLRRGIFVNMAALATVLVAAIPRFAAERGFGVEAFAEVSLAFSLQNILLTVIAPVSLVMLPSIRRLPRETLSDAYRAAWDLVIPTLMLAPVLYFPLTWMARVWLSHYSQLPGFIGALTPLVVFEVRTRVFSIPFLQALHKERWLVVINVAALCIAALSSAYAVSVANSPRALVLTITFTIMCRALALEFLTERTLRVSRRSDTLAVTALTLLFLVSTQSASATWSWALLGGGWILYLFAHRRSFVGAIRGVTR